MRVVVTGGAGFIGANLSRVLLDSGSVDEVVVLDDLSTGYRSNLDGLDVTFVEGSILDPQLLTSVTEGSAAVVHLAARPSVSRSVKDPMASHVANATGTLNVLEAARAHDDVQVIVASSSSVYGSNPVLPKHEDLATRPMSPYAASKLAAEAYTLAYQATYGLQTLAFRFFNVFGPLQAAGHAYAAVIPAFVDAALRGKPLPIEGDGTQSRDFTYVDTVAAVITDAIVRRTTSTEPVNLAFGTRTTLLELIGTLETELGRDLSVEHLGNRPGDVPHSQAANDRLRALFPTVEPVSLEDGIKRTVAWFRNEAESGSSSA